MADEALAEATGEVLRALADPRLSPAVETLFDEATNTATHVVWDRTSRKAAVIDSVLDFDPSSGRVATDSADRLLALVERERLAVDWVLETHVHADHLTAAACLKRQTGAKLAIGRGVLEVQKTFSALFNLDAAAAPAFDRLLDDGDRLKLGDLEILALATPGHTPADMTFVIGDKAFVGDTIFMPDAGTARADFVGASAAALYRSIRRLLALPPATELRLCHDYKAQGREDFRWTTTVGEERAHNVHMRDGVEEPAFVGLRQARDATLPVPRLFYPALQVNIRAGRLPTPEANGARYFKLPLGGALSVAD